MRRSQKSEVRGQEEQRAESKGRLATDPHGRTQTGRAQGVEQRAEGKELRANCRRSEVGGQRSASIEHGAWSQELRAGRRLEATAFEIGAVL